MKKRMKVWLEQRMAEGRRELEQRLDSGGASSERKEEEEEETAAESLLLSAATWCSLFGVWVLPEEYSVWFLADDFKLASPSSVFSWFGSGYSTCVSPRCFWFLFHIFVCEGGPWLLRSVLAATCPCGCLQAQMPCILVGMDQKDIYAAPQRPRSSSIPAVACSILLFLRLALCSLLSSPGPDALHHGRYAPGGQLVFEIVVDIPFRAAEADPHGPDYSAVPCDSTVAVRFLVIDVPVVRVVQILRCCRGKDVRAPTVAAR